MKPTKPSDTTYLAIGLRTLRSERPAFTAESLVREADRSLRIKDRAARLAASEQPSSDADQPSEVEGEIQAWHEDKVRDASDAALRQLAHLAEFDARLGFDANERTFNATTQRLQSDLRIAEQPAKEALRPLVRDETRSKQQLELFKTLHGLEQDINFRNSLILWLAILLAGPLLEGVVSAGIFGEGDALGALGGWFTAGLLGLANASVGCAVAYGAANWVHNRSVLRRIFGGLLTAAGVAGGAVVNLFASHWRAAMTLAPDHPLQYVNHAIVTDPLGPLYDMKAIALLLVSALFIALVAWETTQTWGAYCGYRERGLKHRRALVRLERKRRDLLTGIEHRNRAAKEEIEDQAEVVSEKVAAAKDLLSDAVLALTQYAGEIEAIRSSNERCHALFRETNRRVRQPSPAPAYFRRKVQLEAPAITLPLNYTEKAQQMAREGDQILSQQGAAYEAIDNIVHAAQARLGLLESEAKVEVIREWGNPERQPWRLPLEGSPA